MMETFEDQFTVLARMSFDAMEKFYGLPEKKFTNADWVRSLSNEGLAGFLTLDFCGLLCDGKDCDNKCTMRMYAWLKEEATDGSLKV